MSFLETVRKLLGIKPVSIGKLNKYATREYPESKINQKQDSIDDIEITPEYLKIRQLLESNASITFVSGNAGTGKSTLIRYLRHILSENIAVVAPTGVAALNVKGMTIHSLFRFPPRIMNENEIHILNDRKLFEKLDILIIDEVSMVRCDLMDNINIFLKKNRSNNMPFGGVKLLLIGDLFQLPPVETDSEKNVLRSIGYESPFFFSAFGLKKCSMDPVELKTVFRQEDKHFIDLLNHIRVGENLDVVLDEINDKCYFHGSCSQNIILTCKNIQADKINKDNLSKIKSKEYCYNGKIIGKFSVEKDRLPSPMHLKLKIGAQVMFTKNDVQKRWVNGTIGIVKNIDDSHISVKLLTNNPGLVCDIPKALWQNYKQSFDSNSGRTITEIIGEYIQYPIMLAWAVTIHKSQGKTLESVLIDFGDEAFCHGQVYVALSRCKSIDMIRLKRPIKKTDVICDPRIKIFYNELQRLSHL